MGVFDDPVVCEEGSAWQCYSPGGLAALSIKVLPSEYTIGGMIIGLTGNVALVNNGTDSLMIGANGKYTLAKVLTDGNPYFVTIGAQPANQT